MFKKELFDQIKNINVSEIEVRFNDLRQSIGEEISLDRFTTLVKAAKNSVNFEEWTSILTGIETNLGPIKMNMQELEALRGGVQMAGSNFGWNQIYSAAAPQREALMKEAIQKQKNFDSRRRVLPCANTNSIKK